MLHEGARFFRPIFWPHGFEFRMHRAGRSSGGEVARFGEPRADRPSPIDGEWLTQRQRRELWILAVLIWIGASGLIVYVAAIGCFGAADIPDLGSGYPDGGSLIDFGS